MNLLDQADSNGLAKVANVSVIYISVFIVVFPSGYFGKCKCYRILSFIKYNSK